MTRSDDLPLLLFDRLARRQHRDRAARRGFVEFLHREVADRLVERLDDVKRDFRLALDLGAHNGALSRALGCRPGIEWIAAADPSFGFLAKLSGIRVAADPDLLPFRDGSFDLVASILELHWAGDLPGALVQIRRILKPGGLFLAAMLGGSTLVELRTALIEAELVEEGGASPRVSPAAELGDVAGLLLRTGFAMPVADAEKITVTYPDALALMRDLRGMGESNALTARRRTPLRRATLTRAALLYAERFGLPDGRIPATFEILFLTGRAPEALNAEPGTGGAIGRPSR
jgi:SAM-dependent methyltransferase